MAAETGAVQVIVSSRPEDVARSDPIVLPGSSGAFAVGSAVNTSSTSTDSPSFNVTRLGSE